MSESLLDLTRRYGDRFVAPSPLDRLEPPSTPPRFSVVIPAFEAAATVAAAVDSALAQEYPAQQVIVVDDGSKDGLAGALRRFGDRIKLIRQEHMGGAAARNAGVAAADGEFMATLDADDSYHPRRLEALAALALARPDLDLITTDARFIVNGEAVGRFSTYTPFVTEGQRTAIFDSCFVGGWPAIRLEPIRAIGGFDESVRNGHDWDCWLRLILAGARAGFVDVPYYDYVLHPGTLSGNRVPSLWARVGLLERASGNPGLRPEERVHLSRALQTHRARAASAEVQAILYGDGGRGRLVRLAVGSGVGLRARAQALLALAAPPAARRRIPEYEPAEERLSAVLP